MSTSINEKLLRILADRSEMSAKEFLDLVKRQHNDYRDFFDVAALLHAGYIAADCSTKLGQKTADGTLGFDMQDIAASLCQITLQPDDFFMLNDSKRNSWHDFPLKLFITSNGLLKIEELDDKLDLIRQRRRDNIFAIFIAILAAIVGGLASNYFSTTQSNSVEIRVK